MWTYIVVFGAYVDGERRSVVEVGGFKTATEAVEFSIAQMGKTVAAVLEQPNTECLGEFEGLEVVDGFTVERYDGEATDGNWYLNGGLKK